MTQATIEPAADKAPVQGLRTRAGILTRQRRSARSIQSGAMLFPPLVLSHYRTFILDARYGELGGIPKEFEPPNLPEADRRSARRPTDAEKKEAHRRYEQDLQRFQRTEGEIQSAYWCVDGPSAVALTLKQPRRFLFFWRREPTIRLHRATDWITHIDPVITHLFHHCDTLAIKASEILYGPPKRIAMEWIFSTERLLLATAEHLQPPATPASGNGGSVRNPHPARPTSKAEVIKHARDELRAIEDYYDRAGTKAARIVYCWGMVLGVLLTGVLLAGLAALVNWSFFDIDLASKTVRTFFVCAGCGALGALFSVLMRMRKEDGFTLDYEVGPRQARLLGAFRPLVGAISGLLIFLVLESGLLHPPTGTKILWYAALAAFLAGFSERLTHVVMGQAEKTIGPSLQADEDEQTRQEQKQNPAGRVTPSQVPAPGSNP